MENQNGDFDNLGSNQVLVTGVVFFILSGLAVALRFLSKITNPAGKFGWDDWWILIACLLFFIEDGLQIAAYKTAQDPKFDMEHWLKLQYATTQFYTTTACLIKISLLCLYRRLFDTRPFRIASFIVMALCILWAIAFGFSEIFICNPPQHFWEPGSEGYCYPYGKALVSILALEVALDTIILILPMRVIWKLQMSRSKKISVSLMFLCGGFAVLTNIIRVSLSYDPKTDGDVLWLDQLWLNIHFGVSIICACLPVYGPLLQRGGLLITTFWARHITSSPSQDNFGTAQPTVVNGTTTGQRKSLSYAKMEGFSGDKLRLVDRKSDFSLTNEDGTFVGNAAIGRTTDMV